MLVARAREWAIDQRQGDLRSARDRSPISTHFPGISISGHMWFQVTPLDDGLDCTPLGIYDEWPQRKLVCRDRCHEKNGLLRV